MDSQQIRLRAARGIMTMIIMGGAATCSAQWYWDVGDPIDGVGEIQQTWPPSYVSSRTNLHYSGGASACETADFEIDVSNATDWDAQYCSGYGPLGWADAGLEEWATDWSCRIGAGTVADHGFATKFVPSSGVYTGIGIACRVYEGWAYSFDYENYDDPVDRNWGGSLTTFRVGIQMTPGPSTFWEDDLVNTRMLELPGSNCGLLFALVDWTGIGATPGQVTRTGDMQPYSMAWLTVAGTEGGNINATMGTVNYTAKIDCYGRIRIFGVREGPSIGGTLGTLISTIAGQYQNPYVQAAVKCLVGAVGTATHYKVQLLGRSVLENYGVRTIGTTNNFVGDSITGVNQTYQLSTLNMQRAFSTFVGITMHGSLDLESLAQVYDNSIVNDAYAIVDVEVPDVQYYGATKPTYSSTWQR
jgi:hypothetical protein